MSLPEVHVPAPVPHAATLVRWKDVATEPMNPLLTRASISGSQAMIARIELKKGCVVPKHSHPNEQIAWVTEGCLVFVLGGVGEEKHIKVSAGEVLVVPANLPHAAEALEDTVDYDIFAPPRADWLANEDSYLR